MFSHVFIGTNHFERTFRLYAALMEALGNPLRFCDRERPWAGWQSHPGPRPLLLIGAPYDGNPHAAGNGQMVALTAADRATVDLAYQAALDHGAMPEGAPGLRPEYHAHYYAAYFRDTEGNKICVVCHDPEPAVAP
jgi:lactoylglutathione lyase